MSRIILSPAEEIVSDIVRKTKILGENLSSAIVQQDNLTKECFGTTVTEENVEKIKAKYKLLDEQFQTLTEQVNAGQSRLKEILEECKTVTEENDSLKKAENGFSGEKTVYVADKKLAEELRLKLKACKLITGMRFDFNGPSENVLSGYVGIPGNKPSNSTLIPFEVDKNTVNIKQQLWDKISEACSEITDST